MRNSEFLGVGSNVKERVYAVWSDWATFLRAETESPALRRTAVRFALFFNLRMHWQDVHCRTSRVKGGSPVLAFLGESRQAKRRSGEVKARMTRSDVGGVTHLRAASSQKSVKNTNSSFQQPELDPSTLTGPAVST